MENGGNSGGAASSGGGGGGQRLPLSAVVSDCVRRWFQDTLKEAKAGDLSMQVLVSQMYFHGYGIPKDPQKDFLMWNREEEPIPALKSDYDDNSYDDDDDCEDLTEEHQVICHAYDIRIHGHTRRNDDGDIDGSKEKNIWMSSRHYGHDINKYYPESVTARAMSTPGGSKRASDITNIEEGEQEDPNNLHSRERLSPQLSESPHPTLKRHDSLDIESDNIQGHQDHRDNETMRTNWRKKGYNYEVWTSIIDILISFKVGLGLIKGDETSVKVHKSKLGRILCGIMLGLIVSHSQQSCRWIGVEFLESKYHA
nr:hypothetical protein [Tanacetum cinerariifolium]